MTEREKISFSDHVEQEQYQIFIDGYDYNFSWGIGSTTFCNSHSLYVKGRWSDYSPSALKPKFGFIHIDQSNEDPDDNDDELFHDTVGPPRFWDDVRIGQIEATKENVHIYVNMPRSGIMALLTMLSAKGHKSASVIGSKLKKQDGLSDTAVGYFKTAQLHRISFNIESNDFGPEEAG